MGKKKQWSADIAVAVLLLAAGLFLTYTALTTLSAEARQFPLIILTLLVILSVVLLVNGILDTKAAGAGKSGRLTTVKWEQVKYPLFLFAMVAAYVVAIDLIGFLLPSLLFTAALMRYNSVRSKLTLLLVPCGLVGFLYVLFTFFLKAKLP